MNPEPEEDDEPDWLTAPGEDPNPDDKPVYTPPKRADYQDRAQPCEACQ